ncbi:MAG TPA: HAMP domain-containing sensor histidine kinase [Candidatus Omnitrophota bacterium]|nr:HAMP domain-containing sensor histidine kinase [Candidatus Omnitrophota bacterium]
MRNILIVGGNQTAEMLIPLLKETGTGNILGVVGPDPEAPALKLARSLDIPVAADWKKFLADETLGQIIVTGEDPAAFKSLSGEKPARAGILDASAAKFLAETLRARRELETLLDETREELSTQMWGLQKTNQALKLLYGELEEKNKKLQELDKLKSNFVSHVSHELRAPLTIIKGYVLTLFDETHHATPEQAEYVEIIRESVDRLARMIENLLDISKIEAGMLELKKTVTDLVPLTENVVASLKHEAGKKGVALSASLPDRLEAFVDPDRIIQILTNLVVNAVKFTPENGRVTVTLSDEGKEIRCGVSDSGVGISRENLEQMFTPFKQFGQPAGQGPKGTGLGLAITKELIHMHHGEIRVESEPGRGSRFLFTLPKPTAESIITDPIESKIRLAEKKNTDLSLVVVALKDFPEGKRAVTEMIPVLKKTLLRPKDAAFSHDGVLYLLFENLEKKDAPAAIGKIRQALTDFLNAKTPGSGNALLLGCATYPDDAETCDDLLAKARASLSQ